ncbi:MAG: hypothetical protein ACI9FR_000611 [Cryomorphaceae bacterium]|jgi:hypothetical protein
MNDCSRQNPAYRLALYIVEAQSFEFDRGSGLFALFNRKGFIGAAFSSVLLDDGLRLADLVSFELKAMQIVFTRAKIAESRIS